MAQAPVPFGKYSLHERLASTPVADIYRAATRTAGGDKLTVVVKRLREEASRDPSFLASFVDEARVASLLEHPNIAKIYEWGKHEESLFIAMEYIQGTNLGSLMQSVLEQNLRLPPTIGLHIICEVLTGLAYAHALKDPYGNPLGLVHRDVSPPNIVLSSSGEVKLVDFGLAKLATRIQSTLPGAFAGKFTYMSPEQIRRREVDYRADIFSCGVILYELLTGTKLKSKGEESDIRSVLEAARARPPSSVHADIPFELDRLVARAMDEDPAGRPPGAVEMLGELSRFLDRWDRKVDAASLSVYLVDTLSGRAGEKPQKEGTGKGKPGFAFGEATSQWMAQGDNLEELVRIHSASPDDLAEPVQSEQPMQAVASPEQLLEAEFKPPKRRFSTGQTVMAILQGGLGKRRQLKNLLILLGGAALVVLVVMFVVSSLGDKGEDDQKDALKPPPAAEEAFAGAVQFVSEPAGALVFVDGDPVTPEGRPPRVMGLRAGVHRIKLVLPGYLPWEEDVTLEAEKPKLIEQKLEERFGNVVISSKPPKAKVFFNGELVGRTPKTIENLSAARSHKVVLKATGRRFEPMRFTIEPPDWPEEIEEDLKLEKQLQKRKPKRRRR